MRSPIGIRGARVLVRLSLPSAFPHHSVGRSRSGHRTGDVVHTNDRSAPCDRDRDARRCGNVSLFRAGEEARPFEDGGEEALARCADQNRPTSPDPSDPVEESEVVFEGLAEPDPGIDDDPTGVHTGSDGGRRPSVEEPSDVVDDAPVRRRVLHRGGLSLHVHDDDADTAGGTDVGHRRGCESSDVVDRFGSGGDRRFGDGGFAGVHRDDDTGPGEWSDDGDDAPDLFVHIDGAGTRSRRLTPDVDDVGTAAVQAQRLFDGRVRVEPPASVGEGVGRDVDDAHDERVVGGGQ